MYSYSIQDCPEVRWIERTGYLYDQPDEAWEELQDMAEALREEAFTLNHIIEDDERIYESDFQSLDLQLQWVYLINVEDENDITDMEDTIDIVRERYEALVKKAVM